jgi:hypothetical protein
VNKLLHDAKHIPSFGIFDGFNKLRFPQMKLPPRPAKKNPRSNRRHRHHRQQGAQSETETPFRFGFGHDSSPRGG